MGEKIICYCSNVSEATIIKAIEDGASSLQDIREMTGACTIARCRELSPTKKCCSQRILEILKTLD